jgi:hypothetical protein
VRAGNTLPIILLSEQALKAFKWLGTYRLHSVECVHHVGLDVGVLSGPA